MNQTMQMVQIYKHLSEYECYFTPYYSDGFLEVLVKAGLLNFTILGNAVRQQAEKYLQSRGLKLDPSAQRQVYDLILTCSDLIIPKNISKSPIVLVQEGMIDPENFKFHLVRKLDLPRYLANTSMTGLSNAYERFCVASEGFRELFIKKGVPAEKIVVTGIPNFDNAKQYLQNDFPYKGYILAATSHLRESYKFENRKAFIKLALTIADGRPLIFKLHPREDHVRARREIDKYAPKSIVFIEGNTNHMIANCDALVTRYSSVLLVALALNKPIYSDLPSMELPKLTPLQNGGKSAANIANICKSYLN